MSTVTITNATPVTVYVQDSNPGRTQRQMNKWRNAPQAHFMSSAHLLIMYGGMGCAMSLGFNNFDPLSTEHYLYSYFIGVIIGAVVAAPLVNFVKSKFIIILAALSAVTSAIIFTSVPYEYEPCLAARYLNGISTGLAVVTFIVNGSEISSKSYRGTVLSMEQSYFTIGIAVQIIYSTQWDIDFSVNRLHGILGIIFGVLALGSVYFIVESPVFHLRKGDENAALSSLKISVRPAIVNDEIRIRLDTLKSYVAYNEEIGLVGSAIQGALPLVKMILYRSCVALSFSLPLNMAMNYASIVNTGDAQNYIQIVFACLRMLGAVISIAIMDGLGRKAVAVICLCVMGGLTIGAGSIFGDLQNTIDVHEMSIVCTLTLLTQFFAGLFSPSSAVYLGEAFPLLTKSYFIALSVIAEQIIQIIVISCSWSYLMSLNFNEIIYDYGLAAGIILLGLGAIFSFVLPETNRTTLTDAQKHFKHLFNFRFW